MKQLVLRLIVSFLKGATLSLEDRALLTTAVLDRLIALPASAILRTDTDGTLVLNGKRVDARTAMAVNRSAVRVLNERAFKVAMEQTKFLAVELGVYQGLTPDQTMFAKAALWQIGEHFKVIQLLAGNAAQEDQDDDD